MITVFFSVSENLLKVCRTDNNKEESAKRALQKLNELRGKIAGQNFSSAGYSKQASGLQTTFLELGINFDVSRYLWLLAEQPFSGPFDQVCLRQNSFHQYLLV